MKYLLGLLTVFVVTDGLVTKLLIERGLAIEGNPLLQPIVGQAFFLILKVAGALICALILWDIYRRFPRVALVTTWSAVVVYGAIISWNSSLFLIS